MTIKKLAKALVFLAAGSALATGAFAQSAKDIRGASPYIELTNEPAPRLIVVPPVAEALDASDNNTVDIAGLPPGQHKVKIQLVDANHNVFPGQVATLTFTVPEYDRAKVYGHGH